MVSALSVIAALVLVVIAIWGLVILLSNPVVQVALILIALAGFIALIKRAETR
jgi:hypothetical protein